MTALTDVTKPKRVVAKQEDRPQEPARPPLVLGDNCLELAEVRQQDWRVVAPAGTTAADLHMTGAFSMCRRLSIGDRLTIVNSNESMLFRAVCVRGDGGVTVASPMCAVLDAIKLPRAEEINEGLPPDVYVRRATAADGRSGWICAVRRDGEELVLNGHDIYERVEADTFLRSHASVRGRNAQA